jgi:hypothetical protein
METTKNKMSDYGSFFLEQMSKTLDTKLYFYGSIQRYDYYPNKSDIDIDIFADNVSSMKYKLYGFLNSHNHNKKNVEFKSFVLKTKHAQIVRGIKVSYKDKERDLFIEINLFDEKYKKVILEEHNYKTHLPFYVIILFTILKFCHYQLQLLSINDYRAYKEFCLNYLLNGHFDEFINLGA